MTAPVVVTGALGNVGTAVVQGLLDRGVPVRAADIAVEPMAERFGPGVESAQLPTLLGRPARSVRDYVAENRELWAKP